MSLDAHAYKNILTDEQVKILKDELIWLENNLEQAGDGFWLDKNHEPTNAVEKYILSTYKTVLKDSNINESDVVGFEWWHHYNVECCDYVDIHFDTDESKSNSDNPEMFTPLRGTVTYIEEPNQAPTIIYGIKQNSKEISDISENIENVVYSYPEKGKLLSFDGKYLHGVFPPSSPITRMTLMYNIWSYRLPELFQPQILNTENKNMYVDIEKAVKEYPVIDSTDEKKIVDIYYSWDTFRATTHLPFRPEKGNNNLIEIECNNKVIKNG